jgi:hypothetical protein
MDRKMLALTLNRSRGSSQDEESFWRATNAKISELTELFAWTPLVDQALHISISWQGHLARMNDMNPVVLFSHWRCASSVRTLGLDRPLRVRRGPPILDAVESLVGLFGSFWHVLAQDRHEGRGLKQTFLDSKEAVERPMGKFWGGRFLRHISSSSRDVLRSTSMRFCLPLVHVSDSMLVVEFMPFVKSLRWSLYAFEFQWKFACMNSESDILVHRLRHFNSVSDHFANHVLDSSQVWIESFLCDALPDPNASIVLSSDGACRGNPGPGSASAVIHVLEHGVLRLVSHRSIQLGRVTNNQAEYEGACLAHSLLIDWSIRAGLFS